MTAEAFTTLVQTVGSLGALTIVAGLALRHLHQQLVDVQEKRTLDAQASTAKLLQLVEAQHAQIKMLAEAIDAGTDASREMRLLIESLIAERGVHRYPSAPRRGG